jgi:Actin
MYRMTNVLKLPLPEQLKHWIAAVGWPAVLQVPVVGGYAFSHLSKRLNVAGRHVTSHLVNLLQRRGYALNRSSDFAAVGVLKEKLCYVAASYDREIKVFGLGRQRSLQSQ